MITCEKITVRLGKTPASDPDVWGGAWAGITNPTTRKGFVSLPSGVFTPNDVDETGVQQKFPRKLASQGPITCIAIAADSPIEACDLYVSSGSESNVHRVSVGCPYVGLLGEDTQVRVVPIRPLPLLADDTAANFAAKHAFWDCIVGTDDDITAGRGTVLLPIRLDVYRGGIPPIATHRAPYYADVLWNAGALGNLFAYVIVDGRRRFRVMAAKNGAPLANVEVWGILGHSSLTDTAVAWRDRRIDLPESTIPLLAVTALDAAGTGKPIIYDHPVTTKNPLFAVLVKIKDADANATGYIQVHAWDD